MQPPLIQLVLVLAVTLSHVFGHPVNSTSDPIPSLSAAEAAVKAAADAADVHIRHLSAAEFVNHKVVGGGDWILFFGSVKCPHCQKLTPEFLKFQQRREKDFNTIGLKLAKIECTALKEICLNVQPALKFYPTIRIYKDGKFTKEYEGDDEIKLIEPWVDSWIKTQHGEGAKAMKQAEAIARAGLLLSSDSSSKINPDGKSVPINSKNIGSLLDQSSWFVKFYSPYCHHCVSFAPMWTEIAKDLKGAMNVGEVDCTVEMDLCKKYDIQMYPTVMHVGTNLEDQFQGVRTKENLMVFAKQYSKPAFKPVIPDEINTVLLTSTNPSVFYLYDHKTTPLTHLEQFAKVSATITHLHEINVCPEGPEALKLFPTLPASTKFPVLLISQGERGHKDTRVFQATMDLKTDAQRNNVRDWILKHARAVLMKLDETTSRKIMDGVNTVVLGLVKGSDEVSKKTMVDVLREAGKKWNGQSGEDSKDDDVSLVKGDWDEKKEKVVFAWIDVLQKGDYVQRAFGVDVKAAKFPLLVVVDSKEDLFYDVGVDQKALEFGSRDKVLENLDLVIKGKLVGKHANGGVGGYKMMQRWTRPFATFVKAHPLLTIILLGGVILLLFRCALAADRTAYAPLREPKAD